MRTPGLGEANLGALAGAVIGSIGGLFAVGIPSALIYQTLQALFATPKIGLICFLLGGPIGWIIGGQIGPPLGQKFFSPRAEIIGGALGGLVPVLAMALWGWYMISAG